MTRRVASAAPRNSPPATRGANRFGIPHLGVGVGLRSPHYADLLADPTRLGFVEIITENYAFTRGRPRHLLAQVAERLPVVMHGVSLNLGSTDPLDRTYLAAVKALADETRAVWVGDHLCWTGIAGRTTHDLLPLPLTEAALRHCTERLKRVQGILGRPVVLENPSTYVAFAADTMPEWEFLARLAEASDCALLLDVNNVYVASRNHGFDPHTYIQALPMDRVVQVHLAGHTDHGTHCVDTHIGPVVDPVVDLYRTARDLGCHGSPCLEWDAEIPDFATLCAEAARVAA